MLGEGGPSIKGIVGLVGEGGPSIKGMVGEGGPTDRLGGMPLGSCGVGCTCHHSQDDQNNGHDITEHKQLVPASAMWFDVGY